MASTKTKTALQRTTAPKARPTTATPTRGPARTIRLFDKRRGMAREVSFGAEGAPSPEHAHSTKDLLLGGAAGLATGLMLPFLNGVLGR